MAKKSKKKTTETKNKPAAQLSQPWISMRVGIIIIAIVSIAMAIMTGYQASATRSTVDSILLGLFFGGLIWAVFLGNLLINRFLRRKK